MFDSVLLPDHLPKSRLGAGAVITLVIHVVVIAGAAYLSSRPVIAEEQQSEVKFFAAPPAPPPPPPAAGTSTPKVEKKVEKKKPKPLEIVQPKEIPQEKPPEAEPEPEQPAPEPEPAGQVGGVEGGVAGGVVGGTVGGVVGGVIGGKGNSTDVMPFGEGMVAPPPLATTECMPTYTREALEAHVEGTMIVKCVITIQGRLRNCRVIKPLPLMTDAVLDRLGKCQYAPVTFQGKPIDNIEKAFNITFKLPR